ncbi:MAG: hypothetical protein N4A62_02220 [Marinisporobacter sp.]|nr:hypothetical protein [Marinisporobacter sp.]
MTDTEFWKNTGSTITSIKRNDQLFISPGPYFVFKEGDIISFVCTDINLNKIKFFVDGCEEY